jgi:hypothetical protein
VAEAAEEGGAEADDEVVEGGFFELGGEGFGGGEEVFAVGEELAAGFDFACAEEACAGELVFRGIAEDEADGVVAGADEAEGGDGFGVVEVAEDDEERALGEGGFEGEEALAEEGGFVEAPGAEGVEPLEEDVA